MQASFTLLVTTVEMLHYYPKYSVQILCRDGPWYR